MKVREVMNKYPISVSPKDSVVDVARLLVKHNQTALPVVDEDNHLLGIISEGDMLYKKIKPHTPHYVNILGASIYYGGIGEYNEQFKKLLASHVEDLMTVDVVWEKPETDIEDLVAVMVERHLKMVPVVEDDRLIGAVSRHDIMKVIAEEEAPHIVK